MVVSEWVSTQTDRERGLGPSTRILTSNIRDKENML